MKQVDDAALREVYDELGLPFEREEKSQTSTIELEEKEVQQDKKTQETQINQPSPSVESNTS